MHFKQKKNGKDKEFFYSDYESKRDLCEEVKKQVSDYKREHPNFEVKAFHNDLGIHVYAFDSKNKQ